MATVEVYTKALERIYDAVKAEHATFREVANVSNDKKIKAWLQASDELKAAMMAFEQLS